MAAYIVYQIVRRDPARHYWIVVLSTAELYGGYVLPVLRSVNAAANYHYYFPLPCVQLDDVLPRVAHWQSESGHLKPALPLGLSCREFLSLIGAMRPD